MQRFAPGVEAMGRVFHAHGLSIVITPLSMAASRYRSRIS
jgi:hypothetical protein